MSQHERPLDIGGPFVVSAAKRSSVPPPERHPRREPQSGRPAGRRPGPPPARKDGPRRSGPLRPDTREDEASRRPRLPEPDLPPELPAAQLDRAAKAELRSLPESLAERITSHLVAAGLLIDDDPDAAHQHAWYARSLAPRLALVREAAGLTAYRTGDFAAALAEL